jgi:regulatory protein
LRLLARRDYSRAELAARLTARGIAATEIDATLDDFERLGYLSDARYAQGVVAQRIGRYGKRAIARDLRGKGIAAAAAGEALSALARRVEQADATALWQRRFGQAPADERDKARHVRFLMARGYSAATALEVLRAAGARGEDDGD